MSGDRKIVLHVGLPKTGTTTIQNVLRANREFLLAREAVLYPSFGVNPDTPLGTLFRDEPLAQQANKMAGLSPEEIAARREGYLSSLEAEVSSREWDTLLLSGEVVSNFTVREISRLREWGEKYSSDWTVLVCVRHPVDWVRSVVQQLLKGGDTLERLYERPPLPAFSNRISRVISVFGQENVRVFDFESAARNDGGIVGAFAAQAGLSMSAGNFLASQAVRDNESLSLEAVRILDSLNRRCPVFNGNVRAPRRSGKELAYLRRIKGQKFTLPDRIRDNVRLGSREDVVWLNATFGLDLYRDVTDGVSDTERQEEPVEVLSDPTVDSVAEIIGELVAAKEFFRALDRGKMALARGDIERAGTLFRKAARLDPDAPQPKKLLKRVNAKRLAGSSDARQARSEPWFRRLFRE